MPLLSTIRDAKRLAISTKQTIKNLGGQVDVADLLAMETLRVFRPEIFQRLLKLRNELTGTRNTRRGKAEGPQEAIKDLIEDFNDEIIPPLLYHVFPLHNLPLSLYRGPHIK
jgi:P-loop domain protein, KAP family